MLENFYKIAEILSSLKAFFILEFEAARVHESIARHGINRINW